MKTKIKLYGKMAKIYGKNFEFANINKAMDAVSAMETKFPGFRKYITDESKKGSHYEILSNSENRSLEGLKKIEEINTIEIVPCIIGSGPLLIVIGGALAAYAGTAAVVGTAFGSFLFTLGVGLIIAGIMYLLTPIPENEPNEDAISTSIKNSSFLFQSPQNVSSQGRPVPIGYGRLRVGSYVVGSTISNFDLSNDRQNDRYEKTRSNALLNIQKSFGSSVSNYIRGY